MPGSKNAQCYIEVVRLGGRLTVRLRTLDPPIGVRIPASQPNRSIPPPHALASDRDRLVYTVFAVGWAPAQQAGIGHLERQTD